MRTFLARYFILLLLCGNWHSVFGGDADTLRRGSRLPVISIAQGMMYFLGDVGYSHLNEPVTSRSGLQFELQQHTNTRLSFSLFILGGRVAGTERNATGQLNFLSGIVAEGIMVRYDFYSRRREQQFLTPYLTAGVEYMLFRARGDLKDGNGRTYHYWSDGSIRDLDQNDSAASQAQVIYRDYDYETDLRDANMDGFGKYRQSTIGFPVGAGVKFRISSRVSMHFGANVHLTRTDLIENVNDHSREARKGNGMSDKVIFSFVSFRYDMSGKRDAPPKSKPRWKQGDFKTVNFDSLATEDADGDGIPDIQDAVFDSASHVQVDANGKPLDSDDDGIPDYRDDEPASAKNALVNERGVTITEEMIEAAWRADSMAALPKIVEYLHHTDKAGKIQQPEGGTLTEPASPKAMKEIPRVFRSLDTDKNNQLSPGEIGVAIDLYLEGKSSFTIPEFYQLIDFFFSQQ